MTNTEREQFLAELHVGVVTVAEKERGPLVCPVWYTYSSGGVVAFCTKKDTRKARILRLGTRVGFLVQLEGDIAKGVLPKYVAVEGPADTAASADAPAPLGAHALPDAPASPGTPGPVGEPAPATEPIGVTLPASPCLAGVVEVAPRPSSADRLRVRFSGEGDEVRVYDLFAISTG